MTSKRDRISGRMLEWKMEENGRSKVTKGEVKSESKGSSKMFKKVFKNKARKIS